MMADPPVDWNLRAECHNCNLMHSSRHVQPEETMEEYLAYLERWEKEQA